MLLGPLASFVAYLPLSNPFFPAFCKKPVILMRISETVTLSPSLMANSIGSRPESLVLRSELSEEIKKKIFRGSRAPSLEPRVCNDLVIIWKFVRDTALTPQNSIWSLGLGEHGQSQS